MNEKKNTSYITVIWWKHFLKTMFGILKKIVKLCFFKIEQSSLKIPYVDLQSNAKYVLKLFLKYTNSNVFKSFEDFAKA